MARRLLKGRADATNPDKRVNAVNPNIPDDQVHLPSQSLKLHLFTTILSFQGRTALHAASLRGAFSVCAAIVEHGKVETSIDRY